MSNLMAVWAPFHCLKTCLSCDFGFRSLLAEVSVTAVWSHDHHQKHAPLGKEMLTIMRGMVSLPEVTNISPPPSPKVSGRSLVFLRVSSVTCQVACKHPGTLCGEQNSLATRLLWIRFLCESRRARPFGNVPGALMLRSRDMVERQNKH